MPNDHVSSIGPAIALESGAPAVSRTPSSVPAEASSTPAVKPMVLIGSFDPSADPALVKKAAEQIKAFVQASSHNLNFSVDKGSGRIIVKVVDQETGEVIRQIPAEETLAIANSLDTPRGVFIRSKA